MENKNKILVNDKMPPKKKQVIKSSAILKGIEEKKKKEATKIVTGKHLIIN